MDYICGNLWWELLQVHKDNDRGAMQQVRANASADAADAGLGHGYHSRSQLGDPVATM